MLWKLTIAGWKAAARAVIIIFMEAIVQFLFDVRFVEWRGVDSVLKKHSNSKAHE